MGALGERFVPVTAQGARRKEEREMKISDLKERRIAVVGGLTFLLAVGSAVFIAPNANALSGRRICEYSGTQKVYSANNGTLVAHQIWAMNYKKQGGCPTNGNHGTLSDTASPNSWAKITCEAFGTDIGVNYDPCSKMANDAMYKVEFWYSNGHQAPTYTSYGHY
jgi:hypothetical protein